MSLDSGPKPASCLIAGPEDAGFRPISGEGVGRWQRLDAPHFAFRLVRTIEELADVERLQREVFGVSDLDLMAASMLVALPESGGDVIGVFDVSISRVTLAGFVTAFGGYVDGRPRLCSDMMAIHPGYRRSGLATLLKRLQGALAIQRGFEEVTWTVDPLRSANARLNFGKLGAIGDRYERNRYGASYGTGLYGGMPTDRIHISWPVRSERVQRVLAGGEPSSHPGEELQITIPDDIDALVQSDPDRALGWRYALREALESAFDAGYRITGFVSRSSPSQHDLPALVLTRSGRAELGGCR
ncbi:MAG: GNAT family N-acetyltransferase [Planctomycetaceae bacterium]